MRAITRKSGKADESLTKEAMKHSSFEDLLRQERDRFVAFAFASADVLVEVDEEGIILFADGATRGLMGYASDELLGQNIVQLMQADEAAELREQVARLDYTHRLDKTEIHLLSRHHDAIPFLISGFRLGHVHKHTYLAFSLLRGDVSPDELFKRDFDTGLYKKSGFVEVANERLQETLKKEGDASITLMSIPGLKDFLDSLSREQAENLLKEIAAYLREHSLGGDTAGMVSENTFTLMQKAGQNAAYLVQDIIDITRRYDARHEGLSVREATIEVDIKNHTAQDSANILLYTINRFAESQGEAFNVHSLAECYEQLLEETVDKIVQFKETVRDEDFNLAFQPIVDLKTGIIHHYEVLVRMKKQELFNNPFEFINFGEKTGAISDFDLLMVEKSFEVLKATAAKGNHPLLAVNISGRSMSSALFKDALEKVIARYSKYRKQMIFEITESAKIEDMKVTNTFIQKLRKEGNLFCLDDFGTGESSFEYLRNLQVDFIKIDGSYVRESLQTQRGRHMLRAMAGLCKDLNVTTIGEMVEDEQAASLLWEAGVKFGQGYLFGKPEVDAETIINCKKPTPFYAGIMRAKKFHNPDRKWWKPEE